MEQATRPERTLPWAVGRGEPDDALPVDDTSYGDGAVCRARSADDYRCSMRSDHGGDRHRAGTGAVIVAEWATDGAS